MVTIFESPILHSVFSPPPRPPQHPPYKEILHKTLFSNAPGSTAFSQEHLRTITCKIWGATECIMGYSKIENRRILVYIFLPHHFPEAFHARFPVSVKSLKVSRSCIERIGPPRRTREKKPLVPRVHWLTIT